MKTTRTLNCAIDIDVHTPAHVILVAKNNNEFSAREVILAACGINYFWQCVSDKCYITLYEDSEKY